MVKAKKRKKEKNQNLAKMENIGEVNYPVGDFLVRIKNACLAKHKSVTLRGSKKIKAVADVLKRERYLDAVSEVDGFLSIKIAYKNKEPRLLNVRLISKPSLRVYKGIVEIEALKGPSMFIISTPLGVLSTKEAIKKRVGGEVIAEVL